MLVYAIAESQVYVPVSLHQLGAETLTLPTMDIRPKTRAAHTCSQWDCKVSPCFIGCMYVGFTYQHVRINPSRQRSISVFGLTVYLLKYGPRLVPCPRILFSWQQEPLHFPSSGYGIQPNLKLVGFEELHANLE